MEWGIYYGNMDICMIAIFVLPK